MGIVFRKELHMGGLGIDERMIFLFIYSNP